MDRKRFQKLVDKHLDQTITIDENDELERYYDIYVKQLFSEGAEYKTKNQMYSRILAKTSKTDQGKAQKKQYRIRALKIAASISIFVALAISTFLYESKAQVELITVSTKFGQKQELTLPDSSLVTLNAGSSITYPERFTGEQRAVQMSGEIFFDIKHDPDHPFIVNTESLMTKVLGTTFNIKAYGENPDIKISLATGYIKISNGDYTMATLYPDEQFVYTRVDGTYQIETQQTDNDTSWLKNILAFDDHSLVEAVEIIERWFNVKLQVKLDNANIPLQTITGKFIDPTLEETIQSLELLSGSNITYENNVEP